MNKEPLSVPLPTIRRIPAYLHQLQEFQKKKVEWVSTTDIAQRLELKPIQVRKDMAFTGITGTPKRGYKVTELRNAILQFLGWNNTSDALLVGAGALGSALLGYHGITDHGLNIIAAFDKDPAKTDKKIHGKEVFPVHKLPDIAARMFIQIGIITVPAAAAQETADLLVESGIKAIWNFSPAKLKVPEDVVVQKEDLSAGLAVLSVKLRNNITNPKDEE
ncbi:MAG: redox-sensing transcriptional repressor Rex [Spirochaetia bacterium]